MKTEIHIVSYARDLPYLRLCLKSIAKFAQGFSGVTLVVPSVEADQFKDLPGIKLHTYLRNPNPATWHLAAQCQKCFADLHCPAAEFIAHVDSDCIYTAPITPERYFVQGKPVMLYQDYDRLPPTVPWKLIIEAILHRPVGYEFMRRHPQVNPVGVYSGMRHLVAKRNTMEFQKFVETRKPDFVWGFSEHNVIGAFAFYDPHWHGQYHWHDLDKHKAPRNELLQFWSHKGVNEPQPSHQYADHPEWNNLTPEQLCHRLGIQ